MSIRFNVPLLLSLFLVVSLVFLVVVLLLLLLNAGSAHLSPAESGLRSLTGLSSMRMSNLQVTMPPHRRTSQDRSLPGSQLNRGSRPTSSPATTPCRSASISGAHLGEPLSSCLSNRWRCRVFSTNADYSPNALISQAAVELGVPTAIKSTS